jgi:hypothetical protein
MEYLSDRDYQIAESNGISRHNAYQRFYSNGWSKERAITEPLRKDANYKRKCQEIGLSYHTFCKRRKLGWSMERALTEPVNKKYSRAQ